MALKGNRPTLDHFRRRLPHDTNTPTSLSLELLRNMGYECLVVEVNMRIAREFEDDLVFKKDLLGFLDILAFKGKETRGVQTTDRSNMLARVKKVQCTAWFESLKRAGWTVHVHGWGKHGVEVIDMTARDAAGAWVYPTLWEQILIAKEAKKKFPQRGQSALKI